ncbi:PTS sugar transporter subunit IIA [Olsenella sp. HMSC062G07]|uniref:PTS sugar transporter subunit IIA n=1 Tax=Olsenella sp. HMSC062G07 TaxID=1739330 RepID=UPI0008A15935|nr:hypothetical protein [Olsenella sp. HMSC062G07]OFK22419.1 hypothetical protein HMPREF2826_01340 [Olsenella sp. HMSC062G07]
MKFVLVSHGDFAKGLLSAATMLLGPQAEIEAVGLYPQDGPESFRTRLEAVLLPEDEGNVIFFSDLFHGTPFNVVTDLSRDHDIYHVTGANLAVLLEALLCRSDPGISCQIVCDNAITAAKESVLDVRELLSSNIEIEDENEIENEEF